MEIVVATIGLRGDVQPYINLCQALLEAGHEVVLATNPTLCALAAARAVELSHQLRIEADGLTAAVQVIKKTV